MGNCLLVCLLTWEFIWMQVRLPLMESIRVVVCKGTYLQWHIPKTAPVYNGKPLQEYR